MPDVDDEEDYPEKRIAISHRVRLLERDVRGHSRMITNIVDNYGTLSKRVEEFEDFKMERLVAAAREDERDKALADRLQRIETRITQGMHSFGRQIDGIKAAGVKLLWIVIGAVVPAVLVGVGYMLFVMAKIPLPPM